MVKWNLFYTLFSMYKIVFHGQQGCEQRKTPTQQYVQDMTKILHDAENCNLTDLTLKFTYINVLTYR